MKILNPAAPEAEERDETKGRIRPGEIINKIKRNIFLPRVTRLAPEPEVSNTTRPLSIYHEHTC